MFCHSEWQLIPVLEIKLKESCNLDQLQSMSSGSDLPIRWGGGGLLYNVGYLIHRSTQQWPVCRCRVVLQCCIAEDLPPAGLHCSSLRQSNNAIILIVANKPESVRCPGAGLPCQRRRRRSWWRANRLASDRLSKPLTPLNTPTGRLTAPGR